jgi:hypothetical protein
MLDLALLLIPLTIETHEVGRLCYDGAGIGALILAPIYWPFVNRLWHIFEYCTCNHKA